MSLKKFLDCRNDNLFHFVINKLFAFFILWKRRYVVWHFWEYPSLYHKILKILFFNIKNLRFLSDFAKANQRFFTHCKLSWHGPISPQKSYFWGGETKTIPFFKEWEKVRVKSSGKHSSIFMHSLLSYKAFTFVYA